MRIGLNQQIQFPEITHGSITYDEFNVYCVGAKISTQKLRKNGKSDS